MTIEAQVYEQLCTRHFVELVTQNKAITSVVKGIGLQDPGIRVSSGKIGYIWDHNLMERYTDVADVQR